VEPSAGAQIDEHMQFRVSAVSYRMEVEPDSTDLITNAAKFEGNVEKEAERRGQVVEERWRANGEWMKGRSRDEVDQKKQEFQEKYEKVVEESSAGRRRS